MKSIDEVLELIPLGVTNPFFCRIDGVTHIAKWENCDEMHYPLVNEHIGYEVCKFLGINLPPHEFVTITEEAVAENKTDLDFQSGDLFFASQQIRKAFKFNSGLQLKTADPTKIIEMMFIDVILCNTDRNEGNILLQKFPNRDVEIYAIDYSHAFYKGCLWSEGQFKHLIEDPTCLKDLNQYFHHTGYQIIFSSVSFAEEQIREVANRLKCRAQEMNLDEIFLALPQKLRTLCSEADLSLFNDFLKMRFSQIDSITDEILDYLDIKKLPQPNLS
ncbi:HipA family kinase [Exiguobacterium undae]|uniref:HipA family kinase n=1 Tax=Exiguobacterium undae TaxID=169177 RepID=UPI00384BF0BB